MHFFLFIFLVQGVLPLSIIAWAWGGGAPFDNSIVIFDKCTSSDCSLKSENLFKSKSDVAEPRAVDSRL